MAVDDVARRAGHKHASSLRAALERISTLEKRIDALEAVEKGL